ncbi:MAG: rod shape-determining protein [Candidatus Vogelbacteria bacterium CG10_big_fil_rev_8_21_14_0_10_49_38]|uniref:Cell shape-determining protein MreB n=1 Tax=Candidatus Vogelbacteria bacterium CG10_big_fil_rev_8_21_14_0_10_49_38 TaxID=1975043 RepID=A0A2H0RIY5_9BACT|nr:MAG: rod shape-determining protein [bacterium CG10_49_38]PIR45984.1 MAG: rod shape-determining protein [Candidatus Vogelbacteria bacterium CG10_big_fil_rev_8_21_14_0_10_49_38]
MFWRVGKILSNNVGIDLGTSNTLVHIKGHGIVIDEPSVVAINQKTGRVVAVGTEANQMIGRTPAHIQSVKPLSGGVISNYEVAEEMISYFLKRTAGLVGGNFFRPRVVVGVPSSITNVERRAVRDATISAGARVVHIIEEPMAAAIGVNLPIFEPVGNMVVDIGGGTTDIAVISLGGMVKVKNLAIAGEKFNQDIINYVRDEFKILLGDRTAEEVKIKIGAVIKQDRDNETLVRGRDLVTGLPREVAITDVDIREAIFGSLTVFVDAIKEVLETTPPEVVSDIMRHGLVLTGGGSLIRGLSEFLVKELEIPVSLATEPLLSVVNGTGVVLDDLETYRDLLIDNEEELTPK